MPVTRPIPSFGLARTLPLLACGLIYTGRCPAGAYFASTPADGGGLLGGLRGGSLSRSASPLWTLVSRLRRPAQEFLFQPIGFIECQVTCLTSVRNCLMDERRSEMNRMYVADAARGRCDGHAFDLPDVSRFEIGVVRYQVPGYGATNAKRMGQCDVYLCRTDIR